LRFVDLLMGEWRSYHRYVNAIVSNGINKTVGDKRKIHKIFNGNVFGASRSLPEKAIAVDEKGYPRGPTSSILFS